MSPTTVQQHKQTNDEEKTMTTNESHHRGPVGLVETIKGWFTGRKRTGQSHTELLSCFTGRGRGRNDA